MGQNCLVFPRKSEEVTRQLLSLGQQRKLDLILCSLSWESWAPRPPLELQKPGPTCLDSPSSRNLSRSSPAWRSLLQCRTERMPKQILPQPKPSSLHLLSTGQSTHMAASPSLVSSIPQPTAKSKPQS